MTLHCAVQADEQSIQSNENNGVHIDNLLKQYANQFDCIGNFHGKYHIVTDPQVQSVIHAHRKCPIQFKNEIKNCLDEMVENGVIRKVDEPGRKESTSLAWCMMQKEFTPILKEWKTSEIHQLLQTRHVCNSSWV